MKSPHKNCEHFINSIVDYDISFNGV